MSGVPAVGPRYRILRRLGQGGMAEVFEAELAGELGFARRVAIKRMLDDAAADPRAARRFLDEARIASRLHHAAIVAVTDVGLLDGLPFQVLELVDGINAHQLLQRAGGAVPLEVALAIAGAVAHALEHAHAARDDAGVVLGVVHRDVKPANILVSWAGDVKLADFGIALARGRSSRTETGVAPGTQGFMAPEQRLRTEVDGRADVFALGLTLHTLITGRNPMQEPAIEVAAIEGDPIPLAAELPDDVRRLIERAVAPARLDRPSAGQLAQDLGAALAPRLTRDPRSVLRDFVAPFAARRPAAGALDHLLGIEVIPDEPAPGEVPRYHTAAAGPPPPPGIYEVPAPPAPPPSSAPPAPVATRPLRPPPGRPARRRAVTAIAALALGLAGLGAWRLAAGGGGDRTAGGSVADATAGPAAAAVAPVAATAAVGSGAAGSGAAGSAVAPPGAAAPAPAPAPPRPRPGATPRRPAPAATSITSTAAAPAETGWLLVYGEDLVGSRVLVDGGRWIGSVPNPIEVTVGRRRVAIVRRDGTQLPPQQVDVASFHSPGRPLRITW